MATDPRVSVDTKENLGELSIRNIVEHDAGEYSCTVEFSNRLPQTTTYTVYIVGKTFKGFDMNLRFRKCIMILTLR